MKYSLALRLLHWAMAALIIGLLAVGFYMADIPEQAANKYDLYPLHKAFGFVVLMLVLVRIGTRLRSTIPAPPSGLQGWEVKLSHAVHLLLYLSMFSIALSGYLMSSFYVHGHGIDLFGLITLPDLTGKSEQWSGFFHSIHTLSAYTLVGSLLLHLAGVVKHRLLDAAENDVLGRMV